MATVKTFMVGALLTLLTMVSRNTVWQRNLEKY